MIIQLESLRGIAALTVVLYHYSFTARNTITETFFILNGYTMVDFFFLLSGYIITLSVFEKLNTLNDIKYFIFRRFFRIYPLHFLFLILYTLLEIIIYFFELKTGINRNYNLPNNSISFMHNLILTNGFLLKVETFNAPSWSVSVEFYCYIFFSILVFFLKKYYKLFAIIIIFISVAILYNYTRIESLSFERITSGYITLFRCFYCFFIGSLFFFIFKKHNLKINKLFNVLILFILGILFIGKEQFNYFLPLIFGLIIFFAHYGSQYNYINKVLSNKILVYLGTISYTIYISHYIILWFFRQFYRFVYKANTMDANSSFTIVGLESYIFILFAIIATIILSLFLNIFLERKFIYFARKKFKK